MHNTRLLLTFSLGLGSGSLLTFGYYNIYKNCNWNWNWDGRHSYYEKCNSNGKRTLTLVRHGQYHRVQGEINDDKCLTEIGKQQSILTGQRLKQMNIKFDKIYCSKFMRAMETAQLLVSELEFNTIEDIEYDADLNEGLATKVYPYSGYKSDAKYNLEMKKTSKRIERAFDTYVHRRNMESMMEEKNDNRRDILIIGHGNVFRYFLVKAMQVNDKSWNRYSLSNACISRINIKDDGTIKISHVNDTAHLPFNLLTQNLKGASI